ncbi:MAG: phosphoribosyltransferase family protein [Ruminiclostridium sp.]|nr:phosphoribosyltransferase family protein [Ruminiclostridium sp.]
MSWLSAISYKENMKDKKIPLSEYVLRFLFPLQCVCCSTPLPINSPMELCSDCKDELPLMQKFVHTNPGGASIGKVYCAFGYEKGIRKAIHNLKFNDKTGNAATLIELSYPHLERFFAFETDSVKKPQSSKQGTKPGTLYTTGGIDAHERFSTTDKKAHPQLEHESIQSLKVYDIILYIPMHPRRKRKRGYNQSELLAHHLARKMDIPVIKKAMVKVVNTRAQSALGKAGRFRNLLGAFLVKDSTLIKGKNVLLVDDVMTTGNTLEQCGKALKDAGATCVDAFVVAMRRKVSFNERLINNPAFTPKRGSSVLRS